MPNPSPQTDWNRLLLTLIQTETEEFLLNKSWSSCRISKSLKKKLKKYLKNLMLTEMVLFQKINLLHWCSRDLSIWIWANLKDPNNQRNASKESINIVLIRFASILPFPGVRLPCFLRTYRAPIVEACKRQAYSRIYFDLSKGFSIYLLIYLLL